MQKPKIGELWTYHYTSGMMNDGPYIIVIDNILQTNIQTYIKFSFLDTWEEDEMSLDIFQKYCKQVENET